MPTPKPPRTLRSTRDGTSPDNPTSSDYPLISIITVCLNPGPRFERTIQGLANQTYPNIEYIVIDGGSVDGTVARIRKHGQLISFFVSEKDKGIYDAMNKGIRKARGEIIGIINADDYYVPDALEQVVRIWQINKSVDVICGNCSVINLAGKIVGTTTPHIDFKRGIVKIPHPATFVSRQCYVKHGVYDDSYVYGGDYELFCRLARNNAGFHHIDRTLAHFRLGGFGSTVGIILEKEWFSTTRKHWGLLAACKLFPRDYLFSFFRRKIGSYLRKMGLKASP